MKILLAQINPIIGDIKGNTDKILKGIAHAKKHLCHLVVFPELSLCGYPPEDLLLLPDFLDAISQSLLTIQNAGSGIVVIVGAPRKSVSTSEKRLYNSAAIYKDQKLIGYQDKSLLPTYDVFSETRYFEPASTVSLWELCDKKVGITICEDIWQHSDLLTDTQYRRDPVLELMKLKPDFVINLSASPYSMSKFPSRLKACIKAAQSLHCPLLLCNQVGGNDSLIFDGHSVAINRHGELFGCAQGFQEDYLLVDLAKENRSVVYHENKIESLYQALVLGVRDYFHKSHFTKACLGLSGGIDSAIVACIASEALGKENVLALNMPSRFSSEESLIDARQLASNLEIDFNVVPIESPFQSYLDLLHPYFEDIPYNVTEENLQARIRGMILMAFSNKFGYIVLSTGNKSELAMGYSTLYGDLCGGLGVINDVTKKQVYALAKWINRSREVIPLNTIKKPPSAELRPNQKDSDTLPDYEIIDNILEAYVEQHCSVEEISLHYHYPLELVHELIKKIHLSEYKRRQSPPGLRVTEKAFSAGRRFPIVQRWVSFGNPKGMDDMD